MEPIKLVLECDEKTRLWRGTSEALPGFRTQGITLSKARRPLRRALQKQHPHAPIVDEILLPEADARKYQAFLAVRETLARLELELPKQRLQLAHRLIRLGMTIDDAARLLYLSKQRLAIHLRPEVQASPDNVQDTATAAL